jgi:4-carboxymuconolactone decarboxylase
LVIGDENAVRYASREERLEAARSKYLEVMTWPGPETVKPYYEAGVVGFVFGEMWPRPLLGRRDRRWITLACVGAMGAVVPIQTHVHAALNSGDCSLEELEEFTLFFGTQCGWPRAQVVDQYVDEAAQRCNIERKGFEAWAEPRDPSARRQHGKSAYEKVMCAPPPAGDSAFSGVGYLDFLYGEVWTRRGLSLRERRIIALSCMAAAPNNDQVRAHVAAALKSGDLDVGELQELVLHFAVYCGWPAAANFDQLVSEIAKPAES